MQSSLALRDAIIQHEDLYPLKRLLVQAFVDDFRGRVAISGIRMTVAMALANLTHRDVIMLNNMLTNKYDGVTSFHVLESKNVDRLKLMGTDVCAPDLYPKSPDITKGTELALVRNYPNSYVRNPDTRKLERPIITVKTNAVVKSLKGSLRPLGSLQFNILERIQDKCLNSKTGPCSEVGSFYS